MRFGKCVWCATATPRVIPYRIENCRYVQKIQRNEYTNDKVNGIGDEDASKRERGWKNVELNFKLHFKPIFDYQITHLKGGNFNEWNFRFVFFSSLLFCSFDLCVNLLCAYNEKQMTKARKTVCSHTHMECKRMRWRHVFFSWWFWTQMDIDMLETRFRLYFLYMRI